MHLRLPSKPARAWALGAAASALLLLAATLLVRAAPEPPAAATTTRPALTVTLVQPQRTTLVTAVTASGDIAAWQEAVIGAEIGGARLAEVRVNVGDRVRRGQVLAVFVADQVRAELAQGRALVAESEATLAEAQANAQRARGLQLSGAMSAQQIQQMLTAERTAAARLQAHQASQRVLELRLAQTRVLASDDGLISARSATLGAVVSAGQELFRLIRKGRLEWRAEVAATELAQLRPGQAVRLTPAGGAELLGKVRVIAPTVDPATRNGLVYVDLPAGAEAKAGMFARGEFVTGSSAALTLPQTAVVQRDGFSYVFRLETGNRVAQTKVGVGRRVADRIEVTGGLDPAAQVVAVGAGFLADGDTVRVVAAAAPTAADAASAPAAGR